MISEVIRNSEQRTASRRDSKSCARSRRASRCRSRPHPRRRERREDRIYRGGVGGIFLEHENTLLNALQQFHRIAMEFSQKCKIFWQVEVNWRLLDDRRCKG